MTDPNPVGVGRRWWGSWPSPIVLLVLVLAGYALLILGFLNTSVGLVVVGSAASFLVEEVLRHARYGRMRLGLRLVEAGVGWRHFARQMLVVVFLLRTGELSRGAQIAVVIAVVAHHGVLALFLATRLVITRRSLRRVETRNLDVPGELPNNPPPPWLMSGGAHLILSTDVLVTLALAWAWIHGSYASVPPAAVLATVIALASVPPLVPHAWALLRLPSDEVRMAAAQESVRAAGPVVILHFSGGINAVYQVNMWLETMERLDRPVLVLLRERRYLDQLAETTVPVLCLPYSLDLMNFEMPHARVSLYVANVGKNIHLLRLPTLMSAFIGHGDSDKTASFNPFTKAYDEVWVAGEAGRQRYLRAQVGIRADQILLVGRPQLDAIAAARPGPPPTPFTVLYAPTWEGWTRETHGSSLIPMGLDIVRWLLASPGIRVLYKPHPLTGTVEREAREVNRQIVDLLAAAAGDHLAVAGELTLYECFDRSDALISDVSSVVSDFLHSEKPYFVTNAEGIPDVLFRDQNPSAGAAYLIGPATAGLSEAMADARGQDSMRAHRSEVRTFLLGDPGSDSMTLFRKAVDDLVDKSQARYSVERLGQQDDDDDERLEQQSDAVLEAQVAE